MKFKLRHMEVFRAVMVAGSINGAAKLLNTSQPGLSKTVAYLEQALGLTLFTRTKSSLVPTREAHILFAEIKELYTSALRIDDLVTSLKKDMRQQLVVAASPSLSLSIVPQAVKLILARHPELHVVLRSVTECEMVSEILARRSDIVVSSVPVDDKISTSGELFSVPIVCAMPRGHKLEQLRRLSMEEVAGHPIILYEKDAYFGRLIRAQFEMRGLQPASCIEVTRAEQACALVRAGLGLTFVSALSVEPGIWTGISAVPLACGLALPVTLAHSPFERLSSQAREFIRFFKAAATGPEFGDLVSLPAVGRQMPFSLPQPSLLTA